PMGAAEQAFTPASDEIALAIEHHHRMGAAIEDVDAVLAVDRDRGDVGQIPPLRQLRPVLHHAITMLPRAENDRHLDAPPELPDHYSRMVRRTRPQMCNCTSGNLEIPGSRVSRAPRNDESGSHAEATPGSARRRREVASR